MDGTVNQMLRAIPSVDSLLQDASIKPVVDRYGRGPVARMVRLATDDLRAQIRSGRALPADVRQWLVQSVIKMVDATFRPHYCKAVNATGIILHTGLGRAVLPEAALEQVQQTLRGYSVLQVDRLTGTRSRRDGRIEWLLQQLTGCQAATVVNNNAAATAIVLNTVAKGKEVIVSRGQLVEIGGSFRLPEVMAFSGARLLEVGTTNRTHIYDYQRAINENTAVILRVHPSNYRIRGFTSEVPLEELVELAHKHNLIMVDDLGAGALIDLAQFGLEHEPLISDSIKAGADIVTCSCDKLIGGPQAGLIIGRKDLIDTVRKNQFARIVRVDKLTLAALEATLLLHLDQDIALRQIPTYQILRKDIGQLRSVADRIADALAQKGLAASITIAAGSSQMGSGSLPTQELPTILVAIRPQEIGPDELAMRMRMCQPPVFTRIERDQVVIDTRTLLDGEEGLVIGAVCEALSYKG
ncbi:MAG: L-seryl-tRNA(Sec) selenium transferase [Sedimentisphaerales bacterium]|nr:L-seryl-tRNA(Sec) selenium transferase [Sedimentisphaerales bacterium]